jgi:hypothetical protein
VILAYAMLGQAWGVVIPSVGGVLLAVLAAASFVSVGANAQRVYAPVVLALCTGLSLMGVQFFVHSAQSFDQSVIFFGWLFNLIVVQTLSERRGFLNRFALAASAIGLGVFPYVQLESSGGYVRAHAAQTGISNANALGMWFGFSTVYFVFYGLQCRNLFLRTIYWAGGLGFLFVVTLTVSRGPLLGIALACVVGLRSALKRYFAPVLSFVVVMWLIYESGVFQQTIDAYFVRGTVETGRGTVWPLAFQRVIDSLWTGVGMEAIATPRPIGKAITPHNAFLYLGLAGGIVPMICFLGYLFRAGSGALRIVRKVHVGEAAVLPPLVTFALTEIMTLDLAFMSAWVVVVFALASVKPAPVWDT